MQHKEDITATQILEMPIDVDDIAKAEGAYFQPLADLIVQNLREADKHFEARINEDILNVR